MRVHLEVAVAPDWRPLVAGSGRMVGGTEALALRLASLLSSDGHEVTFRGGGNAGSEGGVHFLADREAIPPVNRWIAVNAERAAEAGDARRVYWSHAVQLPLRGDDWDEVVAVSGYHARLLETRLGRTVTANPAGVEPGPPCAEPDRFLYASSPDRGLHRLLAAWPAIWAQWRRPLSITYDLRGVLARRGNQPGPLGERLRQVARMLDQPGVVVHGPLESASMAALRARSLALLYPLDPVLPHSELYALSVLEACAAGVPTILSPVDCFPDEYAEAAHFVECFEPEAWVSAIEDVLADRGAWSERARAHATRRPWETWEATWRAVVAREDRHPTPDPRAVGVVLSTAGTWAARWLDHLAGLFADRPVMADLPPGVAVPSGWSRGGARTQSLVIADPASGLPEGRLAAGLAVVVWCPGVVQGEAPDPDADRAALGLAERGAGLLVGPPSASTLAGAVAVARTPVPSRPSPWRPPELRP